MAYVDHRTRQEKARDLRYKHAALESLGAEFMETRLYEIIEACDDVQYFMDSDGKTLLDALDGDDDEVYEFQMMFADLSGDAYKLSEAISDWGFDSQEYDDVTVAMVGERYTLVGYDSYETDYFRLANSYEEEWAQEESAKRLMAKTKKELVECVRRNWCIFLAFFDLDQRYQHLKATMDILRGDNTAMLAVIRNIEVKYEAMMAKWDPVYKLLDHKAEREFDALKEHLPDRAWIE